MQIRSITVGAQRKIPHPAIDFAAVSGMVNITANLSPEDNLADCAQELQTLADVALEAYLDETIARLKPGPRQAQPTKAREATAAKADALAAKYGGKKCDQF